MNDGHGPWQMPIRNIRASNALLTIGGVESTSWLKAFFPLKKRAHSPFAEAARRFDAIGSSYASQQIQHCSASAVAACAEARIAIRVVGWPIAFRALSTWFKGNSLRPSTRMRRLSRAFRCPATWPMKPRFNRASPKIFSSAGRLDRAWRARYAALSRIGTVHPAQRATRDSPGRFDCGASGRHARGSVASSAGGLRQRLSVGAASGGGLGHIHVHRCTAGCRNRRLPSTFRRRIGTRGTSRTHYWSPETKPAFFWPASRPPPGAARQTMKPCSRALSPERTDAAGRWRASISRAAERSWRLSRRCRTGLPRRLIPVFRRVRASLTSESLCR